MALNVVSVDVSSHLIVRTVQSITSQDEEIGEAGHQETEVGFRAAFLIEVFLEASVPTANSDWRFGLYPHPSQRPQVAAKQKRKLTVSNPVASMITSNSWW